MRKFKDSEGREWSIAVNIGAAKRLKDQTQIDLLDPASLQRLSDSPYDVANAIYVLCEAQAKATAISEEQFGAGLSGDAIEEATDALMLEIVDFFPKRQREALNTLLAKLGAAKLGAAMLAQEKVSSPAMDEAIQRVMKQSGEQIDQLLAKVGESSGAASASPA